MISTAVVAPVGRRFTQHVGRWMTVIKTLPQLEVGGLPVARLVAFCVLVLLFNAGYWGLRMWGHGLWVVYVSLAALVWWRYPTRSVRMRIIVLLALQICFEKLPIWLPPAYGGGDGGYTTRLFLYWPLSLRSVFTAADHGWERTAFVYTVWAILGSLVLLPAITYFRGRRFYCTMLCRWALISETLGEPFRSRAPKAAWARRLEGTSTVLFWMVVVLTLLMAVGLNLRVGARTLSQWYHLIFINYLTFIAGVGIIPLLGARAKCRYNCPMGSYLGFFQTRGRFRLCADATACVRCAKCDDACDMGIQVMQFAETGGLLNSAQCTGCGVCVAICPTDVLSFSYRGDRSAPKLDVYGSSAT